MKHRLPLLLAIAIAGIATGCATRTTRSRGIETPRGTDYGMVGGADGCVCPAPFACPVRDCVCRGVWHDARIEEIELRCGDAFVTYVQPVARPSGP